MKNFKTITAIAIAAALTIGLTACASATRNDVTGTVTSGAENQNSSNTQNGSNSQGNENSNTNTNSGNATNTSSTTSDSDEMFTERDLLQTADLTEAKTITVTSGEDVTITEAGVYILSGTATDVTITVNATGEKDKVQLVLNGLEITNTDAPAIYIKTADKVFITTAEGTENTLKTTGTFVADGETNLDAVIYSKDDLVLNGLGTLNIESTKGNGVSCKDDLKVTGGTYIISCAEDALEANDSIRVSDGTFTINTSKDALHCENDEDNTVGYIYISGGSFNITAKSDGIQAITTVTIDGGTLNITASEGIEATHIVINNGTVNINASDDGINASRKTTSENILIELNGGDITIVMGQGDTDAVDSNGSIVVTGGNINITAQTSSFDYDVSGTITGGTVIVNGQQITEMPNQMMGPGGQGGFNPGGQGGQFPGGQGGGRR